MMVTPQTWPAVAASVVTAAGVRYGMGRFGNRTVRSWATPLGGAILFGGIGYAFDLPDWLVIGGFLTTPMVFYKNIKAQQRGAALACSPLQLPEGKGTLVSPKVSTGTGLGVWEHEPGHRMRLALEFVGEEDEEYRVVLRGQLVKAPKGVLSCHAPGSTLELDPNLKDREALSGLPGLTAGMEVRALPQDYGFELLDLEVLSALGEILNLGTKTRHIHFHLSGPRLRVISTEIFGADELEVLLINTAVVLTRVHGIAEAQEKL